MANFSFVLVLGLTMTATGYTISSRCVDQCKSVSSIKCAQPAEFDNSVLSDLRVAYGRNVVDTCVTPCQCDSNEHVYSDDKLCEIIQSFAVKTSKCSDVWRENLAKWNVVEPAKYAKKEVLDYLLKRESATAVERKLRPRSGDATTANPWENWCKHQCAKGMGGSACYCDIIP